MAVGQNAQLGGFSYVAIGRETTFGTYATCTAALDCLSSSLMTTVDNKILEQIERARTYSKRMSLMKKISGDLEFYYVPQADACNFILQNAFGGTVTSATSTGETSGAGAASAMDYTYNVGNMDQSYPSLCVNIRKGDATNGKVFNYSGVRVNQMSFSAQLNDALKCSVGLVGVDSTTLSNDVSSVLGVTTTSILSFVDGRLSVEAAFASLTSSSFWHIESCEFAINNNLKTDAASGRIGSQVLSVLPPGIASFTLKCKMRYDTLTAYTAMISATKLSAQLDFRGPTLPSSAIRQGIRFNFPTLYINNAGDPSIGGPDQILTSDVDFHVLRDDTTSTGYAVQAVVTTNKQSMA